MEQPGWQGEGLMAGSRCLQLVTASPEGSDYVVDLENMAKWAIKFCFCHLHFSGTMYLYRDFGHIWKHCLQKYCGVAGAEMLGKGFFLKLLYALDAGLKLLLWHDLCYSVY